MMSVAVLFFTADEPCCICVGGAYCALTPSAPLSMPYSGDAELYFTVWKAGASEQKNLLPIPQLHRIVLKEGRAEEADIPVYDWGGAIEIPLKPASVPCPDNEPPLLLDSANWRYLERPARAELFRDGGLRLTLTAEGREPVSFSIGPGREGKLRLFDVGSARLLAVSVIDADAERLVLLDGKAETLLDIKGDRAVIEDGFPTLVTRLGTVRGHERRTRFEFTGGAFRSVSESIVLPGESSAATLTEGLKALAAVQEIKLSLDSAEELFDPELFREAGRDGIAAFFGNFTEARLYPLEEREGTATVGLVAGSGHIAHPKKFAFAFSEGLVSDIEER